MRILEKMDDTKNFYGKGVPSPTCTIDTAPSIFVALAVLPI